MPRHLLVPTLAVLVAMCGACGETRSAAPVAAAPEPANQAAAASPPGSVVTVTATPDARTLVVFAVEGAVEVGTPYRVATADGGRIKGMLQVIEVPGPGRAVARVIALTDPADLPAPGDRVHELASLPEAPPSSPVVPAPPTATPTAPPAPPVVPAETRIAEAEAAMRATLAERERQHASELEAAHAASAALDSKLAAAAAELAAAQAALTTLREQRAADQLARLEAERTLFDLSARVLRLPAAGAELAALQESLRATVGAMAAPEAKP